MKNIRLKFLVQKILPTVYVAVQFFCIAAILLTGPVVAAGPVLLILEILFIALGFWAIAVLRIGRFNIRPTIAANARLNTRGPYRMIRHPMYTAVLGATLVIVVDYFTPVRIIFWILLLVTLIFKLRFEERLLRGRFEGYSFYEEMTWRLIPYIY